MSVIVHLPVWAVLLGAAFMGACGYITGRWSR